MGPELSRLMSPQVTSLVPPAKEDEVHLIIEYEKHFHFKNITAPRANRYIVSPALEQNNANQFFLPMQKLDSIEWNSVDAVLLSGFHLWAGLSAKTQNLQLNQLMNKLNQQRMENTKFPIVHVELASITNINYMQMLTSKVFPQVDSIGLNEQELAAVYEALGGTFDDFDEEALTGPIPSIRAVAAAIEKVFEIFAPQRQPAVDPHYRGLTRIHFHCLPYHIIAIIPEVPLKHESSNTMEIKASRWKNSAKAVARGSISASLTACKKLKVEDMTEKDGIILAPFEFTVQSTANNHQNIVIDEVHPVGIWQKHHVAEQMKIQFAYAPVTVCKQPQRTVGLGDTISSTALSYSLS